MPESDEGEQVRALTHRIFFWVVVVSVLISITLFVASYIAPASAAPPLRDIAMIFFGAVIVTLLHERFLSDYHSVQSGENVRKAILPTLNTIDRKLGDAIDRIVPSVKDETVTSIREIRDKVTEASEFLLQGIGVLRGAKAAGIVGIYPARYILTSGVSVTDAIAEDIQVESNQIRIMGISLGDYFLDRGVLHKSFGSMLEPHDSSLTPKVRALIVNPMCDALKERARWEAGQEYSREPAFFDSTTFIETAGSARIAKRLCEKFGDHLEVRLYRQSPTAFVLLTSRFAFLEAYNYAARGSNVPVFQVQAGSPLYRHYESHFERIWSVADSVRDYEPAGGDLKSSAK